MNCIKGLRRLPMLEAAVVLIVTLLVLALSISTQAVDHLAMLEGNPNGWDLADFGPSLLVLSVGMGIMSVRRWRESERERGRLALTARDLAASEERYRDLIDVSPSPVVVYDTKRTIVFANKAALDALRAESPSDVIGHDARMLVHPDGLEAARKNRQLLGRATSSPFIDVRLIRLDGTTLAAQMATSRTSFAGADSFQVVFQDVSQLTSMADTLKRTTEDTISAMARLAETRDPYTAGHQARVAAMANRIAHRMGLPESQCDSIRLAGIVHDIGKMHVPTEILTKPGRLTDPEFALIKEHAECGYELLMPIEFPWPIAEIVREHHERLDGSGYPRGLKDGEICLEARVIAVADVVEAISSHRPYRPSLGIDMALKVIREGRGTLFDESCVDAALQLASEHDLLDPPAPSSGVTWSAA